MIETPENARDHISGTMTRGNATFLASLGNALSERREFESRRADLRGNASARRIKRSIDLSWGIRRISSTSGAIGGTGFVDETYLDELYRDRRFSDTAPTHDDELVGLRIALSVSGFRHLPLSLALFVSLTRSFARACSHWRRTRAIKCSSRVRTIDGRRRGTATCLARRGNGYHVSSRRRIAEERSQGSTGSLAERALANFLWSGFSLRETLRLHT